MNTPGFFAILPRVRGLRGLDIGCGEGSNTRELARLGGRHAFRRCRAHLHSPRALAAARGDPRGILFHVADPVSLPFADDAFDFVTAFMSLMDIPDQAHVLREVERVLRPGGFLQFSICYPCFDPPRRRVLREADGTTRAIEVAGYFESTDGRVDTWWPGTLPREERERIAPFRTAAISSDIERVDRNHVGPGC